MARSRRNVTQTETVAKPGTGLPSIVTSASFDSTCANPLTCNQPNSTTDARGNVTDYTYSATHGGVLTVTAPAVGGVRPQTRYSYTLTNGEYRLTGTSMCQTGSSCTGTADEVVTAIAYDSSGNVTSTSTGNGSGSLTAASAMTYDSRGNLLTVDGPLSGTADTVRMRYDDGRRLVGTESRGTRYLIDAPLPAERSWPMARLAHIVVPDIPHHATRRDNRRQKVFASDCTG